MNNYGYQPPQGGGYAPYDPAQQQQAYAPQPAPAAYAPQQAAYQPPQQQQQPQQWAAPQPQVPPNYRPAPYPEWLASVMQRFPIAMHDDAKGIIFTGPVRLSYPSLFAPKQNIDRRTGVPTGKPKFGAGLLFPEGADLTLLYQQAQGAMLKSFGSTPSFQVHYPFKDQFAGVLKGREECRKGATAIDCKSDRQPQLMDARKTPILDERILYPGCWVFALVNAYTYNQPERKGVAFGLLGVQKIGDDKHLGGSQVSANDFQELPDFGPSPDMQPMHAPPPYAPQGPQQGGWAPQQPQQQYAPANQPPPGYWHGQ